MAFPTPCLRSLKKIFVTGSLIVAIVPHDYKKSYRHSKPYLCTTLLYWDADLGDHFQIRTGDLRFAAALRYRSQEQAPTKLSYKHLTVESLLPTPYRGLSGLLG